MQTPDPAALGGPRAETLHPPSTAASVSVPRVRLRASASLQHSRSHSALRLASGVVAHSVFRSSIDARSPSGCLARLRLCLHLHSEPVPRPHDRTSRSFRCPSPRCLYNCMVSNTNCIISHRRSVSHFSQPLIPSPLLQSPPPHPYPLRNPTTRISPTRFAPSLANSPPPTKPQAAHVPAALYQSPSQPCPSPSSRNPSFSTQNPCAPPPCLTKTRYLHPLPAICESRTHATGLSCATGVSCACTSSQSAR